MTVRSRLRVIWRVLTAPRSLHSMLQARQERRGVAILVVIAALMIMTVLITELVYSSRVRYMVAVHERDRVQAYWLARSGVNMHQLILLANKEVSNNPQIQQGLEMFGMGGTFEFWSIPFVQSMNTGMLRMLLSGGGDIDSVDDDVVEEFEKTGRFDGGDEQQSSSIFDDRDFLAFDGDFSSEISDHESKVNINVFATETFTTVQESPTGQFLYALMSKEDDLTWFRQRNIDPWEVIGNLKDWVDPDTIRSGGRGGYEDTLYNTLEPTSYLTKNAPFDSMEEIRLVAGWEGEVCDRYCDKMSIYGDENGKINMNTMDDAFILAIVNHCIEGGTPLRLQQIQDGMMRLQDTWLLGRPTYEKPEELVRDLVNVAQFPVNQDCAKNKLTTKSQVFTVQSTGLVGTSEVTIEAVFDFSGNTREGKMLYWRVR